MAINPAASDTSSTLATDQPELVRLLRALRRNRGSGIFFARCNTRVLRDKLIGTVQEKLSKPIAVVHIAADPERLIDTQIQEVISDNPAPVVFVLDLELYLSGLDETLQHRVLQELNWRRGALSRLKRSLVFWLPDFALNLVAREAPDFFDWRSGVYEFEAAEGILSAPIVDHAPADNFRLLSLHVAEKRRRMDTLESLIREAEQAGTDSNREVLRFKHDLALLLAQQGEVNQALQLWRDSLPLYERIGDMRGKAETLHEMADVVADQGNIDYALRLWRESLGIQEQIGNMQGKAATLNNMARVIVQLGDIDHAFQLRRESLEIQERIGDDQGKAATLANMASSIAQQGDIERALQLWREALEIQERVNDIRGKAAATHQMAGVIAQQGDTNRALQLWQESLSLYERIGSVHGKATTLNNMANVIADQGETERALQLWQDALSLYERIGNVRGKATTIASMAWLAGREGEVARARRLYLEAARDLVTIHAWLDLAAVLGSLGLLGERNRKERASYLAQAFWLCLFVGMPLRGLIGLAEILLDELGMDHEMAPLLATTTLLLVQDRGRDHPDREALRVRVNNLVVNCARAHGVTDGQVTAWFKNERLNDPAYFVPATQKALLAIVGDHERLFDPRELAHRA